MLRLITLLCICTINLALADPVSDPASTVPATTQQQPQGVHNFPTNAREYCDLINSSEELHRIGEASAELYELGYVSKPASPVLNAFPDSAVRNPKEADTLDTLIDPRISNWIDSRMNVVKDENTHNPWDEPREIIHLGKEAEFIFPKDPSHKPTDWNKMEYWYAQVHRWGVSCALRHVGDELFYVFFDGDMNQKFLDAISGFQTAQKATVLNADGQLMPDPEASKIDLDTFVYNRFFIRYQINDVKRGEMLRVGDPLYTYRNYIWIAFALENGPNALQNTSLSQVADLLEKEVNDAKRKSSKRGKVIH